MSSPIDGSSTARNARNGRLVVGLLLLVIGVATMRRFLEIDALPSDRLRGACSNRVSDDLLDDWQRIDQVTDTEVIEFGSQKGRSHYREPDPRDHANATGILSRDFKNGVVAGLACGTDVAIGFTHLREDDLVATLEAVGLDDGKGPQTIDVRIDPAATEASTPTDPPIAHLDVAATQTPTPLEFTIPRDRLRRGVNFLHLRFGRTLVRSFEGFPTPLPFAAALTRLTFEKKGDESGPNKHPVAQSVLKVEDVAGVGGGPPRKALVFREGEKIVFPVHLEDGSPRFVGSLFVHPDDSAASRSPKVTARLRAQSDGRLLIAKTELDATPGNPRDRRSLDIDADLSTFATSVALIEIDVDPAPGGARPLRLALATPTIRGGREPPHENQPEKANLHGLLDRLSKSNVVMILLDAAGARHFSAYGAQKEFAPRIDTIARDGLVFERTTTPASYTLPAIGSLFTGQYPFRHGVTESGGETEKRKLKKDTATLASRLAESGYHTLALISNPNAGPEPGYDKGFSIYDRLYADPSLWNEGVRPEDLNAALERHLAAGDLTPPFFLYAHFFPPHAPYRAPSEHRKTIVSEGYTGKADGTRESIDRHRRDGEKYATEDFQQLRDLYDANLHYADAETGRLLDTLDAAHLLENTIVVILGDHGEAFGEHDNLEHGDTTFGEEIEVPWIMKLPASTQWGAARVPGPASLVDVAPTLLTLLGIESVASDFDGKSLVNRLFQRWIAIEPEERPLLSRSVGFEPRYAIRMLGFAYHEDLYTRQRWLFDLEADPLERHPLPIADSPLAEYLRLQLCRFLCNRTESGERFTLTPEEIQQRAQIGYTGGGAQGAGLTDHCPLLRR